jgi:hypothetical protein
MSTRDGEGETMRCAGLFFRRYPTVATGDPEYRWCYVFLDSEGNITALQWC